MKLVAIVALGIICFVGAVAGSAYLGGYLNKESLEKLMGKEAQSSEAQPPNANEEPSTPAQALQEREEKLAEREKELATEEQRLEKLKADLAVERALVEEMQAEIQKAIVTEDEDQPKRLQDVAMSLAKMKAKQAAETLKTWTPEEAANVLRLVKDRDRGKILDAMAPEDAAEVLRALQAPKL